MQALPPFLQSVTSSPSRVSIWASYKAEQQSPALPFGVKAELHPALWSERHHLVWQQQPGAGLDTALASYQRTGHCSGQLPEDWTLYCPATRGLDTVLPSYQRTGHCTGQLPEDWTLHRPFTRGLDTALASHQLSPVWARMLAALVLMGLTQTLAIRYAWGGVENFRLLNEHSRYRYYKWHKFVQPNYFRWKWFYAKKCIDFYKICIVTNCRNL